MMPPHLAVREIVYLILITALLFSVNHHVTQKKCIETNLPEWCE